jgi:hypothetical protein
MTSVFVVEKQNAPIDPIIGAILLTTLVMGLQPLRFKESKLSK